MTNVSLADAIFHLRPEAQFTYTEEDYLTIEWHVLDGDAPTIKEIEQARIDVELARKEAEDARKARRAELLERLGLTEEEAKVLLG